MYSSPGLLEKNSSASENGILLFRINGLSAISSQICWCGIFDYFGGCLYPCCNRAMYRAPMPFGIHGLTCEIEGLLDRFSKSFNSREPVHFDVRISAA